MLSSHSSIMLFRLLLRSLEKNLQNLTKKGGKMIGGIKEYHIKKFSRLVKELEQLRKDIEEYCPDVVFRLNNSCMMEIGIDNGEEDYP